MLSDQTLEAVVQCSKCGFCQPTCPTYAVSGLEHEVARGRHQLVRGLVEGRLELDKNLKTALFQCLMCNACYTNCFPKIKTDEIIAEVRNLWIREKGQPALQRYIFHTLLRHPELLGRLLKMASFGKRSGISGLAQVLRCLGWYGKNIANAEGLLESIPKSFLRERLAAQSLIPEKRRGKVAYFVGCGINYAQPDVGYATAQVMNKRGFEVEVIDNYCCGLPAYAYGDLDSVRWFVEKNIRIFSNLQADYIVTDCASCTSFLKEYKRFVPEDSEQQKIVKDFTGRLRDMTTWLYETEDLAEYKTGGNTQTVTLHDPCHLSHYLQEKVAPREVLKNIPAVVYKELAESDFCCGGAGSYNIAHYDVSMKILKRKMAHVKNTGAQVLATACPACIIQISYGVRKFNAPVRIKHVSELVLENSE
ncbi:(Fe-S)-binding protein [candidate division KSB1 bacterium]|nr:(Fe-S)-binding protein [candidate division KSB1 bacterium]